MANPAKSDTRLNAALCYVFTPVVPLVVLRGKDVDPFLLKHARQSLLWALPFLILLALMIIGMVVAVRADILFICLLPVAFLLPFVPGMYWAKRIYFGGDVTFPIGGGPNRV